MILFLRNRPTRRRVEHRSAFTLLELMVVVVILGILLGVVAYNVQGKDDRAKAVAARTSIKGIENAIEMYKLDVGHYPEKLDELQTQPADAKGWDGPYLKGITGPPMDPWGRPFLYQKPGEGGRPYDVISLGRDGLQGGQSYDGDIVGSMEPDKSGDDKKK